MLEVLTWLISMAGACLLCLNCLRKLQVLLDETERLVFTVNFELALALNILTSF